MVTLFIDDLEVQVEKGSTILQAAQQLGIYIPTLCYHPDLSTFGGCRVCMVEANRKLVTACRAPVEQGMVVRTDSKAARELQRMVVELILTNHNGDCLACKKNGECQLQQVANHVGITREDMDRLRPIAPPADTDQSNPFFMVDRSRCILCGVCIRTCEEINGAAAIEFGFRGNRTAVVTSNNSGIAQSNCESCGECLERCPTGALAKKNYERPTREVKTICPYCGVGCAIFLGVRGSRIVSVRGDSTSPVNRGQLCVKGRFGFHFVNHPNRLTSPLIRRDGQLRPASWEEALDLVASKFSDIKTTHGPQSLAGISSARCTTEENYLFQKLMRSLGTNNIDHCARLCHAPTVAGLATVLGSGAMTNTIGEIEGAGTIFVIGSNTSETHPVIGYRVRKAVKKGAKLIVADPRRIPLADQADVYLPLKPGTDIALLNAMLHVIVKEGLQDQSFIQSRTEGFQDILPVIEKYTPEFAEELTGVPAEDIVRAARLYAKASSAAILYTMGITQHTCGTDNVLTLANLALATGNLGKPHAGLNPLRGQNNVQGACDMGCLPGVLTGYQPIADAAVREKFSRAWGLEVPANPGVTIGEMFTRAHKKEIRAMYIMGENPVLTDPNGNHIKECLAALDFLVVQDIFLTETAEMADVVLPAASFAEKEGTFVNTERRVQRIRQALKPIGQSKPDWEIIRDLAQKCGFGWQYAAPVEIMDEIRTLTPSYAGITYERLEKGGLQWPCPSPEHPGTPILHMEKFSRGLGKFSPVEFNSPDEMPDQEYPFVLSTGRSLFQYHSGSMTRKSEGLNLLHGEEYVEINPKDAHALGLTPLDLVKVVSRRGEVRSKINITDRVSPGNVFMTFHFSETATNLLTNEKACQVAKTPELKVCAVRLEKAN